MVIMLAYMKESFIAKRDHYQVLDVFSGAARIAKLAAGLGLGTAAIDKEASDLLDINTAAGFVFLA